jgi:hypothetical protein
VDFLMAYTGASKLTEINQECLRATTYDCACLTGLKIAGYNGPPPLWMY